MVVPDPSRDLLEVQGKHHPLSGLAVVAHQFDLVGRQGARLQEDRVRDAQLAHVVERAGDRDLLDVLDRKSHMHGHGGRVQGHALGVVARVAVLAVNGMGQGVNRVQRGCHASHRSAAHYLKASRNRWIPTGRLRRHRLSTAVASLKAVSLRAGPYTFSHVTYDPPSDVLYAAIGAPRPGSRGETPESHYLRFDGQGRFSGIILMSPREQLEREGGVYVSLPTGTGCVCRAIEAFVRDAERDWHERSHLTFRAAAALCSWMSAMANALPPFQAFLDEHLEPVGAFLRGMVGPNDAEDCLQETFLAALRAYPRAEPRNLRAWVLTIARRKAIDHHRSRARPGRSPWPSRRS